MNIFKVSFWRFAWSLAGVAVIPLIPPGSALADGSLTITSFGGAIQKSLRESYFEPFAKDAGSKITEDEYNGEISKIRAMVDSHSVSWDVVDVPASRTSELCNQGLIEKIDWKKLSLDRSKFIVADRYDCAVPSYIGATVLAYDRSKLPNGLKTIADLFDTRKFPGKRGLYKGPDVTLEWALIADGVAVKDVYSVLSTPEGVDRALRKLDTIKNDIIWWQSGAQPVQLLADEQVVMTAAYNGRIYDAIKNSGKHFEIMWDAARWFPSSWIIPKGTLQREQAYQFIAFASSPRAQANLTRSIPYGPTNKDAMTFVDPAILPYLPTAPDHLPASFEVDSIFWAENGADLLQRFNIWLAK